MRLSKKSGSLKFLCPENVALLSNVLWPVGYSPLVDKGSQTRRELLRGPGKHSREAPLGRKVLIFNGAFWCTGRPILYIFERRRGPLNVAVPWVTYLPAPFLSTGLRGPIFDQTS